MDSCCWLSKKPHKIPMAFLSEGWKGSWGRQIDAQIAQFMCQVESVYSMCPTTSSVLHLKQSHSMCTAVVPKQEPIQRLSITTNIIKHHKLLKIHTILLSINLLNNTFWWQFIDIEWEISLSYESHLISENSNVMCLLQKPQGDFVSINKTTGWVRRHDCLFI